MDCIKILRSELVSGFNNKLFEINFSASDSLIIQFKNNIFRCQFSSKKIPNGFRLYGFIKNNILYECNRCLKKFTYNKKLKVKLDLHNNIKYNKPNYDVIYFPERKKEIDILPFLIDTLLVEEPIKVLCSNNCKGLCIICGSNLNYRVCICDK